MEDNENKEADMPVISMFFGIIITMNADDHVPPHIHARYQGHEASFTFDGNLLKGDLPRKQRKLVEAWVLLHAEELASRRGAGLQPRAPIQNVTRYADKEERT